MQHIQDHILQRFRRTGLWTTTAVGDWPLVQVRAVQRSQPQRSSSAAVRSPGNVSPGTGGNATLARVPATMTAVALVRVARTLRRLTHRLGVCREEWWTAYWSCLRLRTWSRTLERPAACLDFVVGRWGARCDLGLWAGLESDARATRPRGSRWRWI